MDHEPIGDVYLRLALHPFGAAMKIEWHDAWREPQCAPDPRYPDGIDVDCSDGAQVTCTAQLPYPAKRCGQFSIFCETCHQFILITTAGRVDDPRSVKIACKVSEKRLAH